MKNFSFVVATIGVAFLTGSVVAEDDPVGSKPATEATIEAQKRVLENMPEEDGRDFEFAKRGFIATYKDDVILKDDGGVSYDLTGDDFINGDAPDTVNPSLWRFGKVKNHDGLYKIADGIYQVRNFDNSNITFIEGRTGYIVVDPLTIQEPARAAYELVKEHVGDKPVHALIYSHTHTDHFAGAMGVVDPADVEAGNIKVIAPEGFMKEVVSEWMIAGTAMGRRAFYQFGYFLPRNPQSHVGMGMGSAIARGKLGLIPPTHEVTRTGEKMVIDGVEIIFQLTPGAEAPAEMNFYLPQKRALWTAETATSTLHNVQTLRGANVRDAKAWADYLTEAIRLWGDKSDLVFASHHWPRFGNEEVLDYLNKHRDLYKYIHDQTVRLMNRGLTPDEIAEELELPEALSREWYNRGYYGTLSHNSKAVYDKYMGWYDGIPANLNRHPPVERAKRFVDAMGGQKKVLKQARKAFDAGDYRWSAELAHNAVFADGGDKAKEVLADSYEQLGYQTESNAWRNIYITAARELRLGPDKYEESISGGQDYLVTATPVSSFLDLLAVRLIPEKAEGQELTINLVMLETGENHLIKVRNSVLVHEAGVSEDDAVTLTATKQGFLGAAMGHLPLQQAVSLKMVQVDGDPADFNSLVGMLDNPSLNFNIVEP